MSLQRRSFLHRGLAGAATLGLPALATTLAMPADARPARAADFAANAAGQPLLTPMQGVSDITGSRDAEQPLLRGRWPAELRGRFYRNGPALYERGGERYHHWFDGDGMVQQFRIDGGRVAHRGRLVQTPKLAAERAAGRFRLPAFGTHVDNPLPIGGPDSVNPANTNAIEHAGRVLAMWEGGSAFALAPSDLSTQGPVAWRGDLKQLPFSAHPKLDAAGHLWNFGTQGPHFIAWHITPDGRLGKVQVAQLPFATGMVHDMAITERWLVVPMPPVKLGFGQAFEGPRRFTMGAGEPLRVLVARKDNIAEQRLFELPPEMLFHVGNATEEADGSIQLSYVGSSDPWFLNEGAVALMSGNAATPMAGRLQLRTVRLDMASGRAEQATLAVDGELEFPRIDPRRIGASGAGRARWLVCAASWRRFETRRHALFHGVQMVHADSGRVRRFDYGEHHIVEEHVVVPKPGSDRETDAWLLGTTFDARRQATVLNLLDMARIEDGPVAQAVLPYALPLGFHGNFTAD
ncbi:MAG: carotenoid oxygenase family protein [Rubrivivax sp.]|jgi:carotenoid cleavage dioxygenase|nr:carotenoid oxygenase family protein [Rubrivivax sp.]